MPLSLNNWPDFENTNERLPNSVFFNTLPCIACPFCFFSFYYFQNTRLAYLLFLKPSFTSPGRLL